MKNKASKVNLIFNNKAKSAYICNATNFNFHILIKGLFSGLSDVIFP